MPRHAWTPRFMVRLATTALAAGTLVATATPAAAEEGVQSASASASSCRLDSARGDIHHVIYLQFDNTHFSRDNPNVPSDLEQMPHLLSFIKDSGTLLDNHHTPLISHTATDILTSITGLYPDGHGIPVSNSYRYYRPDGTTGPALSFTYWTDPLTDPSTAAPPDTTPNLVGADGANTPAPWVPYTRAGCNFGAVATANTVLENTGADINTVFGPDSAEAAEARANPAQALRDFVGIAVHCGRGARACSATNQGRPDLLPAEPGGYRGFNALYGHRYTAPVISPGGPLKALDGSVIGGATPGFPGFDGMSPSVSLAYVAAMQEHGIPVTYAYISDAHDAHDSGRAFGPGETGYVKQLRAYDQGFASFFERLQSDGINRNNTLFVLTSDEGDHFVGGPPAPTGCNGVDQPCTYPKIGEISGNLTGLLATQAGITTPFTVHADSAPVVYVTGRPARGSAAARTLERAVGALQATNPYTGASERLTLELADPVEMKLLHMVTGDPARTPTFTMFAKPDYFLSTGAPNCSSPCTSINPAFAWNHGDLTPDITTTWLGLVGPGIRKAGVRGEPWSDHVDIRPTMLSLVGLRDSYTHPGRVLFEAMERWAVPAPLRKNMETVTNLAHIYKQIDAPVGRFGLRTLAYSTAGMKSDSPNDRRYQRGEANLARLGADRDQLAARIARGLDAAAFGGEPIGEREARQLIRAAELLLERVDELGEGDQTDEGGGSQG